MSDLKFDKILNSNTFYKNIESIVNKSGMSYIDAVLFFCEKNSIEIETAASMIKSNGKIKSLIQSDGETLNFLTKTAKLPC